MSVDIGFEDITIIQLRESKDKVNIELDAQMETLFNSIIIPECKAMARAANAPQEFIDGFKFVKTGRNHGKVINTFGSPDVPLAKWWNYGTKKNYLIEPKVQHPRDAERAPRDIEQVGDDDEIKVVHPSMLKITLPDGSVIFRPAAIHPGIEKSLAMERGVEVGRNKLIQTASTHIMEKFNSNE